MVDLTGFPTVPAARVDAGGLLARAAPAPVVTPVAAPGPIAPQATSALQGIASEPTFLGKLAHSFAAVPGEIGGALGAGYGAYNQGMKAGAEQLRQVGPAVVRGLTGALAPAPPAPPLTLKDVHDSIVPTGNPVTDGNHVMAAANHALGNTRPGAHELTGEPETAEDRFVRHTRGMTHAQFQFLAGVTPSRTPADAATNDRLAIAHMMYYANLKRGTDPGVALEGLKNDLGGIEKANALGILEGMRGLQGLPAATPVE